MNGSSAVGKCSTPVGLTCQDPASSVLFDQDIPTLTGLDRDMWASELFTMLSIFPSLIFGFTVTPNFAGVARAEVILFNCEQMGISVASFSLQSGADAIIKAVTVSSCDSLVRVCLANAVHALAQLTLVFVPRRATDWVHIAEVIFYSDDLTCPHDIIIEPPITIFHQLSALVWNNVAI